MLLTDFISGSISALESLYPTAEARNIVLLLCESVIGTKNYTHIVNPEFEIPDDHIPELKDSMSRLVKGEPIQYVIGRMEFCGRNFNVASGVLIPRPETELLVREAIKMGSRIHRMRIPFGKSAKPVRILDLCTGSGNIAWTIALSIPGAKVVAVDISDDALRIAESQDFSTELKKDEIFAPTFVKADVLDTEQDFDFGKFDLIVSNPPYIMESERASLRRNVVEYEPAEALFVPDDDPLIYYRAIARWSERFLDKEGKGLTEINEFFGEQTGNVFLEAGFSQTEVVKDFYDKNRFVFYAK
ncbi:MAG: peptide chain release factor N(5)-glutamine methyltransferase [Bacteroidales bacterium]|nr:peptide chain release factor N(5)-glutamine methyltransferase [Bacteroidales bacterium]